VFRNGIRKAERDGSDGLLNPEKIGNDGGIIPFKIGTGDHTAVFFGQAVIGVHARGQALFLGIHDSGGIVVHAGRVVGQSRECPAHSRGPFTDEHVVVVELISPNR